MPVGNLNVNSFDLSLLILWAAISLYNPAAIIMAAELSLYVAIQAITPTNFLAYIACASLYFYFSQANIRILSTFRKAFIAFGVVYFLGAIDQAVYFHFDIDTYFDRIQPYLITIINAYVLASLIDGGGRQDAGLAYDMRDTFNRWLSRLSLH